MTTRQKCGTRNTRPADRLNIAVSIRNITTQPTRLAQCRTSKALDSSEI
jgi:hypothetical protein